MRIFIQSNNVDVTNNPKLLFEKDMKLTIIRKSSDIVLDPNEDVCCHIETGQRDK